MLLHLSILKFGDITKTVLNTTTHGVEDAVKTVTGIEEYQFGVSREPSLLFLVYLDVQYI